MTCANALEILPRRPSEGAFRNPRGNLDAGDTDQLLAGCAKALFGQYLLRTDGRLLLELDGTGSDETTQLPVLDADTGEPLSAVLAASHGLRHACALLGSNQDVWCWRAPGKEGNDRGQLGNGVIDQSTTELRATQVLVSPGRPLTDVVALSETGASGLDATCAVTAAGDLYCWGDLSNIANGGAQLHQPFATRITSDGVTPFSGALRVSARATDGTHRGHACVVAQAGSARGVWCWGDNTAGGLGLGDKKDRAYPTRVPGLTDPKTVIAFSEGPGTTCALDGGRVLCWGENTQGKLGNGTTKDALSASLVATATNQAITDIVELVAGDENVCALKEGGTAICWGQGFERRPTAYPTSGIAALGSLGLAADHVRFLTSDGKYHVEPLAKSDAPVVREVRCGTL